MGAVALRSPASAPGPAPVFYTKDFLETYGDKDPIASPQANPAAELEQRTVSEADLKERERLRILAEEASPPKLTPDLHRSSQMSFGCLLDEFWMCAFLFVQLGC
eukprot:Skav229284  [mRNA]  locus=scaffold952:410042:419223:- [translate_table: standard]